MPRRALRALLARGFRPVASPKKKTTEPRMSEAAASLEIPPAPEKKKPKRRRSRHVFVRLDDAELAELETRAREVGLSAGAYFRHSALGDAGPRSKRAAPTEESRLTANHIIAVNRVGANVNQGIRALNEIALKAPETRSRDRLADEVMATRELLREAVRAVDETLAASRAALGQ
jgi:hypothetical protein